MSQWKRLPVSGSFSTEALWNDRQMFGTSSEDGRALRCEAERVVNEVAQELRTLGEGTSWFSALSSAGRQAVLQEVAGYAMQAHITAADGREGVARSGVKPTANPSVMICMDPPRYGFAALPADDHVKAFRVLVSVFSVADTRRRQVHCKGTCDHAWHNLSPR
ncbi:hypothetical protein JQK87_04040 [Streptomyces sp. G44]|uniref:DUF5958 family protein n=1 Tax=Streptomyces sp. G44 TaxID=2807632 RepID=UPI0019620B58|nr:DUF5958 family protein [Streptomyces sp. G44]MBM7167589.1 hypothetical protein [Streptomyces sp. G44]